MYPGLNLALKTAPAAAVLSAAEAKARLSIGSQLDDTVVEAFIAAATSLVDGHSGWLGRALVKQTWTLTLPSFVCRHDRRDRLHFVPSVFASIDHAIRIPLPPLITINSIKYRDSAGTLQTLSSAAYETGLEGPFAVVRPIYGTSWPTTRVQPDAVAIEFDCGYGTTGADVPEAIRTAISLMTSKFRTLSSRDLSISVDQVEGIGEKRYASAGVIDQVLDGAVQALIGNYRVQW